MQVKRHGLKSQTDLKIVRASLPPLLWEEAAGLADGMATHCCPKASVGQHCGNKIT